MGLIKSIVDKVKAKRKIDKTPNQEQIETYIESERLKNTIQALHDHDKNEFLYGKGNQND